MAQRLLFLITFVGVPIAAFAQPGDYLPNLTPSDFVITGEVEINLPTLERQPLSGFGPPPRTYVVPAERRSVTRPYKLDYDGLPAFALAAPADPHFAQADARYLRAEGGLGTDIARYGRFDFANSTFFVDADYDGLGRTSDALGATADPFVTFNRLGARGGVRTSGPVTASITGLIDYHSFSLPPNLSPTDERTVSMFGAEAEVGTPASSPTRAGISLAMARTRLTENVSTIESSTSGTRLTGGGFAELLNQFVRVEGGLGMDSFIDGSDGSDVFDYSAGLILQAYTAGGVQLRAGARVLGYSTSIQNGNASSTLIAPVASAELPLGTAGRLFAYTDPHLTPRGLFELLEANPFTRIGFLAPDINTVDGQAGIEMRSGSLGFKAYAGLTISPTRLFFERSTSSLFDADYAKARTILGGADISYVTAGGIEFSAGGAIRDGALTELNQELPYYASTVGRVGAQVPFLDGRGRVGLSAYFEGERPVDRVGTRMLAGFGTLGVDASYEFTRGLSVLLRGERLLGDAERWEGFPQASTTILGGVRLVR